MTTSAAARPADRRPVHARLHDRVAVVRRAGPHFVLVGAGTLRYRGQTACSVVPDGDGWLRAITCTPRELRLLDEDGEPRPRSMREAYAQLTPRARERMRRTEARLRAQTDSALAIVVGFGVLLAEATEAQVEDLAAFVAGGKVPS